MLTTVEQTPESKYQNSSQKVSIGIKSSIKLVMKSSIRLNYVCSVGVGDVKRESIAAFTFTSCAVLYKIERAIFEEFARELPALVLHAWDMEAPLKDVAFNVGAYATVA